MTRIAVISDHNLAGSGIAALLRQDDTFEVFGPPQTEDRIRLLSQSEADVVVLVSSLIGTMVEDLIGEVLATRQHAKVVFIGLGNDDEALLCALRAGAQGALDAALDGDALLASIADVANGEIVISRKVARRLVLDEAARNSRMGQPLRVLTPRELVILRLISRGESNKGIARQLAISEHTVRAHVRTIMRKLEVANRVQAAVVALRNGLAVS